MNVREYRDPLKLAQDISLNRTKVLLLWEMEKRKQNDQGLRNAISNADWKKELEELISLGLVSRIVHAKRKPMEIEYALTNRGAKYLRCMRTMMDVSIEIMMDYQMHEVLIQEGYIEKVSE